MKKFQLKNTTTSTTVGIYDTKAEAIKSMDFLIFKTNSENGQTEEEGLSPFDFTLETIDVDVAEGIGTQVRNDKNLQLLCRPIRRPSHHLLRQRDTAVSTA